MLKNKVIKNEIESAKEHIRRNKTIYISATTGVVVAGITALVMRGRHAELLRGSDTAENSVFVRPLSFLSKQTNNVVNVVEREGRGHPGYLVRCLETNEIFSSQKKAAASHGVSDAILSLHLREKLSDVNGLHFERICMVA